MLLHAIHMADERIVSKSLFWGVDRSEGFNNPSFVPDEVTYLAGMQANPQRTLQNGFKRQMKLSRKLWRKEMLLLRPPQRCWTNQMKLYGSRLKVKMLLFSEVRSHE